MDKKEYLNQISANNSAAPKGKFSFDKILKSKFTWLIAGLLGLLILIMVVSSIMSGNKPNVGQSSYKLWVTIENTREMIDEYQTSIKSSELRGYSASMGSILLDIGSKMDIYVNQTLKVKEKELPKDLVESGETEKEDLNNELFEAKINGHLDNVYSLKMAYLISVIELQEEKLAKIVTDASLAESLESSATSLHNLYDNFHNFTGTK